MKKVVSYLLVLVMMLSLAACGSKSESSNETGKPQKEEKVDVYELLEKSVETIDQIQSLEAEVKLDATATVDGETKDVKATLGLEASNLFKEGMVVSVPVDAAIPDSEPIKGNLYWVDGFIYMNLMEQQMKIEAPIDFAELTTALEGLKDEDATETESETISKEDKEKIEKIANPQAKKDGNKYLVSFELDWDEVVKMMKEEELDAESAEKLESMKYEKASFSIIINKDYVFEELTMSLKLSGDVEGNTAYATVDATIKFNTKNITIDLPDFSSYMDLSALLGMTDEL